MDYRPRLVDGLLDALLAALPALFITGPRATGKTTAAQRAATRCASTARRKLWRYRAIEEAWTAESSASLAMISPVMVWA